MVNWDELIEKMINKHSELKEYDKKQIFEFRLPNVAATDEEIEAIKNNIKCDFDPEYLNFLKKANGWDYFYNTVILFGTNELLESEWKDIADDYMDIISDYVDCNLDDITPIAVAKHDKDVFVMLNKKDVGAEYNKIIWYAGDQVDVFEGFFDFFVKILDLREVTKEFLIKNA